MIEARSHGVAQTRALAARLAGLARAGDLLVLSGDLGAGKTAFAQGFGAGLGVTVPITSPTFTLANVHQGERLLMHHLDVYRIDQIEEVADLSLAELLDGDTVTLVEWGDAILPALPSSYLEVALRHTEDTDAAADDERVVTFRVIGPSWADRAAGIEATVRAWEEAGRC